MPSIATPDAMKSFSLPEPCSDFGKRPRPSPATARSKPATPQTGPAVFSIVFFIQPPSTVIARTVSAHGACGDRPCFNDSAETIAANSVPLPIRITASRSLRGVSLTCPDVVCKAHHGRDLTRMPFQTRRALQHRLRMFDEALLQSSKAFVMREASVELHVLRIPAASRDDTDRVRPGDRHLPFKLRDHRKNKDCRAFAVIPIELWDRVKDRLEDLGDEALYAHAKASDDGHRIPATVLDAEQAGDHPVRAGAIICV